MRLLRPLAIVLVSAVAFAQPAPPSATEIAQVVTLQDAARAGIVDLTAKGGISGDQVAVELEGVRIPNAPVVITFRIEIFGRDANGAPWPPSKAAEIAAAVQNRLQGLKAPDGTPIDVSLDIRVRDGTSADGGTAGYHQIDLIDVPSGQLANFTSPTPLGVARTGEWGANEPAGRWAHEVLHLANLPDRYKPLAPTYDVGGVKYPLPAYEGDGSAASKAAWVEKVLFPAADALEAQYGRGEIKPGIPAGHENDIMADATNPNAGVLPEDLQRLVDQAGVRVHAAPGDALLNKDGAEQNFGVGYPLDLFAPRGETTRVEGLYVYCMDLTRDGPARGQRFDVLGPVGEVGGVQAAALQRLLEVVATHQDPSLPTPPLGAQLAVWTITDALEPTPAEQAYLDEAGIVWDFATFFQTPHLPNPNAGGAATAAVTLTEVRPPISVVTGPSPVPPEELERSPRLVTATVTPAPVRVRQPATLAVLVEDGADRLTIAVDRRKGKRWRAVGDALQIGAPVGLSVVELPPFAKKGAYRVRIEGVVDRLDRPFKVKKAPRR
jgi:hypothetical protein